MAACRRGPRSDHDEGSYIATFEAQSHGFSTGCLRFAGQVTLATTQDSLPVAGSALPDGLGYPQGSDERFQTHVMFVILLSPAFVAQGQSCILTFPARSEPISAERHSVVLRCGDARVFASA